MTARRPQRPTRGAVHGVARTAAGDPLGYHYLDITPHQPVELRSSASYTSPSGGFSFSLPPGSYTVRVGLRRRDGQPRQGGARVEVAAGATSYVEVVGASGEPGGRQFAAWSAVRRLEGGAVTACEPAPAVTVAHHDPRWTRAFAAERALLADALPGARAIEHVGATSVPGLCAAPTVDVLVVVEDPAEAAVRARQQLVRRGYAPEPAPEVFPAVEQPLLLARSAGGRRTHLLHLVAAGSPLAGRYLLFRDFLRADPGTARRYALVKRTLAARYAYEPGQYAAEKARLFGVVLLGAREWRHRTARSSR
ncbi:GrpB family protein [Actinacidiphila sp. bgisy144]|uniref:GrpB family protein n=1 Tax=Actinacidiphila sp. bgisy144 TaxID=3413791 RepID=UPI003EBA6C05